MRVIESTNVDLITPFPEKELSRVWRWLRCKKTLIESEGFPTTVEDFVETLGGALSTVASWGVIDKNNVLGIHHEAPLVGILTCAPISVWAGTLDAIGPRRVWGYSTPDGTFLRLMDEAATVAIVDAFVYAPTLNRIGVTLLDSNYAARRWAKRVGMTFEGISRDAVVCKTEPRTTVQYGITRRDIYDYNPNRDADQHDQPSSEPEFPAAEPDAGAGLLDQV